MYYVRARSRCRPSQGQPDNLYTTRCVRYPVSLSAFRLVVRPERADEPTPDSHDITPFERPITNVLPVDHATNEQVWGGLTPQLKRNQK